ncbi:MAG: M16 family metallopeptidase, partial [Brevibacterium aurantiacum]
MRQLILKDSHTGEGSRIDRSVLPGGLTVTTEHMPGLASETIGIWVAAGSRDESTETAGSTHFLEHMLFKGTATKDAKTIAAAFDRTGGDSNAITAKELTCYYS